MVMHYLCTFSSVPILNNKNSCTLDNNNNKNQAMPTNIC